MPLARARRDRRGDSRDGWGPVRTVPRDDLLLQQPGEEFLGQVSGLVDRMARPPDVGIQRVPVDLAERGQGGPGFGRIAAARGEHQAPSGRGEAVRMGEVRGLMGHVGIVARKGSAESGPRRSGVDHSISESGPLGSRGTSR
jgi:hypothetical protein